MSLPNGDVYVAAWENNILNGKGIRYTYNGGEWPGVWYNGSFVPLDDQNTGRYQGARINMCMSSISIFFLVMLISNEFNAAFLIFFIMFYLC